MAAAASGSGGSSGEIVLALRGHRDWVLALVVLADGRLASGSDDGTIKLWALETGESTQTLRHGSRVWALALLPRGCLASGGDGGAIRLWDLHKGQCVGTLQHPGEWVVALTPLPHEGHEGYLASAATTSALPAKGDIRLWDVGTRQCLRTLTHSGAGVRALAQLPGGLLASGSYDHTVKLWLAGTGECAHTLAGHTDCVCALTPLPGGLLASGALDKRILLWDTKSGKPVHPVHQLVGHSDFICALVSLSGGLLASGSVDSLVKLWDTANGQCKRTLKGHSDTVYALAELPGGMLASASFDKTISLWDLGDSSSSSTGGPVTSSAARTDSSSGAKSSSAACSTTGPSPSSAAGSSSTGMGPAVPATPAVDSTGNSSCSSSSTAQPSVSTSQVGNVSLEQGMPQFSAQLPRCWTTEGLTRPYAKLVEVDTAEHVAVCEYFYNCGGADIPGCQVTRVLRNENRELYHPYAAYRETLGHGGNEKWLWHGTRSVAQIVDEGQGLVPAFNNDVLGALGFGFYAARDLRLSDFFAKGRGVQPCPGETRAVLLLRVAVGRCTEKPRILPGVPKEDDDVGPHTREEWHKALRKPENKRAPPGFHSCVYEGSRHELCWYKELQSFPAYVVEYESTQLAGNPYQPPLCHQLLRIKTDPSDFSCICELPV